MIVELRESWDDVQGRASYSDGRVRVTLPFKPARVTKTWRVGVLVFGGVVCALALIRSPRWASDFDRLVELKHFSALSPSPTLDELYEEMGEHTGSKLLGALEWNGLVPPATARSLEQALERLAPGAQAVFSFLRAARPSTDVVDGAAIRNLREQRDACAIALEVAGLDPREHLDNLELDDTRPFLRSFTEASASEAAKIRHDAAVFEDWFPVPDDIVDVWRFQDAEDSTRRVTILYADKLPLEQVTGTDLIYYREETKAWVLVQYKRMTEESAESGLGYRPDAQLDEELKRMALITVPDSGPDSLADARLSPEAFYIKLVEPDIRRPEGNKLAKGLYFPLSLFELVRASPAVKGPRGGVRIGWRNAGRYLDNSEFITLLKGSWIGSRGQASEVIQAVISAALEHGRAAVLAIDECVPQATRRDGLEEAEASENGKDLNSLLDPESSSGSPSQDRPLSFEELFSNDDDGDDLGDRDAP